MRTAKQNVQRGCLAIFVISLCCALLIGAAPALFTMVVDPYELFGERQRVSAVSELAEKDHYPLWKLARYQPGMHDTVVLGDSRARALRDKYWHELSKPGAINLAYGGATIPEIHATFNLIRNDPAIRNLVIGIQLRSLDEKHKGGMNRVPEAVKLLKTRSEYLKNWSVAKTALKIFKAENPQTTEFLHNLRPSLVAAAEAQQLGPTGTVPLQKLLSPEICFSCPLARDAGAVPFRRRYNPYANAHLPRWDQAIGAGFWHGTYPAEYTALYETHLERRILPAKMRRQVEQNGPADWRGFEISARYWGQLEEIAHWAREHGKNITFVIPPTIVEMQATIHRHGLAELNIGLRIELAKLGTVIDFDYPNALTAEVGNFSDAYHFKAKVSKAIVGEIVSQLNSDGTTGALPAGRRGIIRCPTIRADPETPSVTDEIVMADDLNCRTWTRRAL